MIIICCLYASCTQAMITHGSRSLVASGGSAVAHCHMLAMNLLFDFEHDANTTGEWQAFVGEILDARYNY